MLIEPVDGLQERLLLRKLFDLLGDVTTHSEPVNHARKEVYLVWNPDLLQNLLRLVPLLSGEDLVCLGGRDRKRASDAFQFLLFDK